MGKDRGRIKEAQLNGHMVDMLKSSTFNEASAHVQLFLSLKVLGELYHDASNARFMLNQVNRLKDIPGFEKTHHFTQKTLLTQYVLSLCKLLESSPNPKPDDRGTNPKMNFSIDSLLKLTYQHLREIQHEIPERFRPAEFTYKTVNRHKTQYYELQKPKEALFTFRNKAVAHSDVHYVFNFELQHQDIKQWVSQADELLELCGDILSFYFQLIQEEFSTTPPVSAELLDSSIRFDKR